MRETELPNPRAPVMVSAHMLRHGKIDRPIRWGFMGTAQIARKNWRAVALSGNSTVAAVASRDRGRSEAFIEACGGETRMERRPEAFGSYAELLASDSVDAVYIPIPTGLRKEWVIRAAEAGKHVLAEKPGAASAADLKSMLDACAAHRVQFMDGVMFQHSARLPALRACLEDGQSTGALRRITSAFSFVGPAGFFERDIRVNPVLEPLGCLGDLGWYCIRLSLWAAGGRLPARVAGRMLRQHPEASGAASVPIEFSGELFFDRGLSASFHCSFLSTQQWAIFAGPKGYLRMTDFVVPPAAARVGFDVVTDGAVSRRVSVDAFGSGHATAQESCMMRAFSEQIASGRPNPEWPAIVLQAQKVLDACLESSLKDGMPVAVAP